MENDDSSEIFDENEENIRNLIDVNEIKTTTHSSFIAAVGQCPPFKSAKSKFSIHPRERWYQDYTVPENYCHREQPKKPKTDDAGADQEVEEEMDEGELSEKDMMKMMREMKTFLIFW